MARNYAALPHEYLEEMDELTDEEFGRLARFLIAYSIDGTQGDLSGNERFYAKRVMRREDAIRGNYEKIDERNRANGARGGRPRKAEEPEPTDAEENPTEPKKSEPAEEKPNETQNNPTKPKITQENPAEPKKPNANANTNANANATSMSAGADNITPLPPQGDTGGVSPEQIIAMWNMVMGKRYPAAPPAEQWSPEWVRQLRKNTWTKYDWFRLFIHISMSSRLTSGKDGWRPTLGWVLERKNDSIRRRIAAGEFDDPDRVPGDTAEDTYEFHKLRIEEL